MCRASLRCGRYSRDVPELGPREQHIRGEPFVHRLLSAGALRQLSRAACEHRRLGTVACRGTGRVPPVRYELHEPDRRALLRLSYGHQLLPGRGQHHKPELQLQGWRLDFGHTQRHTRGVLVYLSRDLAQSQRHKQLHIRKVELYVRLEPVCRLPQSPRCSGGPSQCTQQCQECSDEGMARVASEPAQQGQQRMGPVG